VTITLMCEGLLAERHDRSTHLSICRGATTSAFVCHTFETCHVHLRSDYTLYEWHGIFGSSPRKRTSIPVCVVKMINCRISIRRSETPTTDPRSARCPRTSSTVRVTRTMAGLPLIGMLHERVTALELRVIEWLACRRCASQWILASHTLLHHAAMQSILTTLSATQVCYQVGPHLFLRLQVS